jgi:hypothetical protein
VTSETGARRPRSISNFGGLCQTRKTPTLMQWLFFNNNNNYGWLYELAGKHSYKFL